MTEKLWLFKASKMKEETGNFWSLTLFDNSLGTMKFTFVVQGVFQECTWEKHNLKGLKDLLPLP